MEEDQGKKILQEYEDQGKKILQEYCYDKRLGPIISLREKFLTDFPVLAKWMEELLLLHTKCCETVKPLSACPGIPTVVDGRAFLDFADKRKEFKEFTEATLPFFERFEAKNSTLLNFLSQKKDEIEHRMRLADDEMERRWPAPFYHMLALEIALKNTDEKINWAKNNMAMIESTRYKEIEGLIDETATHFLFPPTFKPLPEEYHEKCRQFRQCKQKGARFHCTRCQRNYCSRPCFEAREKCLKAECRIRERKPCSVCGVISFFHCVKCNRRDLASYCSKKCQISHWETHKEECRKARKASLASSSKK